MGEQVRERVHLSLAIAYLTATVEEAVGLLDALKVTRPHTCALGERLATTVLHGGIRTPWKD